MVLSRQERHYVHHALMIAIEAIQEHADPGEARDRKLRRMRELLDRFSD